VLGRETGCVCVCIYMYVYMDRSQLLCFALSCTSKLSCSTSQDTILYYSTSKDIILYQGTSKDTLLHDKPEAPAKGCI